jgi:DNA-binding GntR family transcriptional regulator
VPETEWVVQANLPYPEQVAQIVRQWILTGRYQAGQRLSEVDIANTLHISRSPVREGLRKLVNEGLVDQQPGRGVFVAGFALHEVGELLELREAFDVTGARLAATRATAAQLDEMARYVDPSRDTDETSVAETFDFHVLILRASGNTRLAERGAEVHRQLRLARLRSGASAGRSAEAHHEHGAILEALGAQDVEATDRAMRAHLAKASARITLVLNQNGDGRPGY